MGNFRFTQTGISGLVVIEPKLFGDHRGYFMETWNLQEFKEMGLPYQFVQDNQSMSTKGVIRGLHFQKTNPQGKLVRVISGSVYDVAVDLRKNGKTYGEWFGVELTAENKKQLYVPEGFAHGFLVKSKTAEFAYKCTRFYDPSDEGGLLWNDPEINIKWPEIDVDYELSAKDLQNPLFKNLKFSF